MLHAHYTNNVLNIIMVVPIEPSIAITPHRLLSLWWY